MTKSSVGFILLAGCLLGSFAILPYSHSLMGLSLEPITGMFILRHLLSNLILYSIAITLGLYWAEKVGLRILVSDDLRSQLWLPAFVGGCTVAGLVLLGELTIFKGVVPAGISEPDFISGLLASMYGAINEEVLLRLFVVSGLAWLISHIVSEKDITMWLSIGVASVLFGLAHVPVAAKLMPITGLVIARVLILNAISGIVFGWLYWRYSLITAMGAHFVADIVLHSIVPLLYIH